MADPDDLTDVPQSDHALQRGPGLRIMKAVVDTLLDGAPPELAAALRGQLPDPLKAATRPYNAEAPTSVEQFLNRFRERAGLDRQDLLHEARIAIGIVDEMLPDETMADLRGSFPPEFEMLFKRVATPARGRATPMPPTHPPRRVTDSAADRTGRRPSDR